MPSLNGGVVPPPIVLMVWQATALSEGARSGDAGTMRLLLDAWKAGVGLCGVLHGLGDQRLFHPDERAAGFCSMGPGPSTACAEGQGSHVLMCRWPAVGVAVPMCARGAGAGERRVGGKAEGGSGGGAAVGDAACVGGEDPHRCDAGPTAQYGRLLIVLRAAD